jgi:hypothetical protein
VRVRAAAAIVFVFACGAGVVFLGGRSVAPPVEDGPSLAAVSPPSPVASGKSSVDGRAGLVALRAEGRERAAIDGEIAHLEAEVERNAAELADLTAQVVLRDLRSLKTLRARFLLAGRPIAGVVVDGAKSTEDGTLTLTTLPRNYRGFLIATQPDGAQFRLDPPQDDAAEVELGDVRVHPAGTIAGVVVDESGKPVADATVEVMSSDLDCRTIAEHATDAAGRFSLGGIGPYRYEVAVRGAVGARVAAVEAGATDVRLVVRRTFPVVLRLLDDATGEPVTGPWIACELRPPGAAYDASYHELRHGEREIELRLADPGWYEIDVRLGDYRRSLSAHLPAVELTADRRNVVDVRLRPN